MLGILALGAPLAGAADASHEGGYLPAGGFDILAVLPPAPRSGDPRDTADRAIFRDTRTLFGTPRWAMATGDVGLAPVDLLRDFGCAAGAELTAAALPKTLRLLMRASADAGRETGIAKEHYHRLRPFLVDRGPICEPSDGVNTSYDYPSGHTTIGWTWATLLAELMPDRAAPILARGRAFGESRIVCGVHNASAVDAGRLSASATLAALSGRADFQADLAAARSEVQAARTRFAAPDGATCAAERALVAQPLEPPR